MQIKQETQNLLLEPSWSKVIPAHICQTSLKNSTQLSDLKCCPGSLDLWMDFKRSFL